MDFKAPELSEFSALLEAQPRPISTTMAFVRFLNTLLKDKEVGKHIVPIVADEARTFGMEGLFRQIGIYNPHGQNYVPSDRDLVAYYREAKDGQVLQEGINELGATSSWLAAATSYSISNVPMIPFFIYYSMFGFQRVGDLMWAAGDQLARGFMIGGTSGRTTLNGEGLQHEDGHSHIQSLTIPNCVSYDPAFAFEVAVIMQDGINRMYGEKQEDVFYYITTLNEVYDQPAMPAGAEEGIRKGLYKFESVQGKGKGEVQLLGSGAILRHVREAAQILANDYGISSDVYSSPSLTEAAREGDDAVRWNMLHPTETPRVPYVAQVMKDKPTVAATDYMKLFAEQIRAYVPSKHYHVLGTDGFGRSDSRANLRDHFEVDAHHVVVAALHVLAPERRDHVFQPAQRQETAGLDAFAHERLAQRPLQRKHALRPLQRVELHAPVHQIEQLLRVDVGQPGQDRIDLVLLDALVGRLRRRPHHARIHAGTQPVDVRPRPQLLVLLVKLRRGKARRVHGKELRRVLRERLPGRPEVEQHRHAPFLR